jgi:hypothetical protein
VKKYVTEVHVSEVLLLGSASGKQATEAWFGKRAAYLSWYFLPLIF